MSDSMENRENIVSDYLKLRVLLNRSNVLKNQKTEVFFMIKNYGDGHYSLVATL